MAVPTQARSGFEPIFEMLWRRRWIGLFVFAVGATATSSLVLFLPNLYRASTTLLVERQQIPEDFVRSTVTTEVDRRLQSINRALTSRARLEAMILKYDLYPELRAQLPMDDVIGRMRGYLGLSLQAVDRRPNRAGTNETVAFTISYTGRDPERVALVANELASLYIEEDLKVRESQAAGTAEFLRRELEDMKKKLQEQERLVSEFKEHHMGELPEQQSANLSTLERLNGQLLLNADKQIRAQEEKMLLKRQLAEQGIGAESGPGTRAIRLAKLQQERNDLLRRYNEKYPDVVRIDQEIVALVQELSNADSHGEADAGEGSRDDEDSAASFDTQLAAAQAEIRALQREETALRQMIAQYQERVENTPRREQEFEALSRDYETTRSMYQSLLKRHKEAQLAESLEHHQKAEQFRVLDPAVVPSRAEAPNRSRLILMGLIASLAAAAGLVVVPDRLDSSFHTIDDLRNFSRLPVLATVQRIITPADRSRSRRRAWLAGISFVFSIMLIVVAAYLVAHGNEWLVGALM